MDPALCDWIGGHVLGHRTGVRILNCTGRSTVIAIAEQGLLTFNFHAGQATQVDGDEKDANILAVNYKHLLQFEGERALALKGRFAYTNFEEETAADLRNLLFEGDYYFNSVVSLGLLCGYGRSDFDHDAFRYGANAKYYFNSHIGLLLAYEREDISDASYEMDTHRLGIMGRF